MARALQRPSIIMVAGFSHAPKRRRRGYFWLGMVIALGNPLGLLLMRGLWTADGAWTVTWFAQELRRDPWLYLYLWASTSLVMGVLGALLGREEDRLLSYSVVDGLTGLGNRRYFDLRLAEEWARHERSGQDLALLLIDVDHLKQINDQRGHEAGDAALRTVAQAIHYELRASDVGARFGGDELAVLMPSADERAGVALAERIRRRLAGLGEVTVSIGVAAALAASPPLPDAHALVRAADAALYDAKHAGRDRTRASLPVPSAERPSRAC